MANPSNLYAEKVYSEHPTYLWSLDDSIHYIDLIGNSKRTIQVVTNPVWQLTNCSVASLSNPVPYLDIPFPDSVVNQIEGQVPSGTTTTINMTSPAIIHTSLLDQSKSTFCIGSYVYVDTAYLKSLSIGFKYYDTTTLQDVVKLETFETNVFSKWVFISGTFDIPQVNADIKIVLEATYNSGGGAGAYTFFYNGLSFGQWSEEFNAHNLGSSISSFPSTINLDNITNSIIATSYGLEQKNAYYICSSNTLFAKNTSIPMAYGSNGSTSIYYNPTNKPSLIFPGNGVLNNKGKFLDHTIEFWLRISPDTNNPIRIFGPVNSEDGLYIENGFLILKIKDTFTSHFVSEWFRPMLIHIKFSKNYAALLINGEEVGSFTYNTSSTIFPNEFYVTKSQDWLGFYSSPSISAMEIDTFAIYSYLVSESVAKRRFVYGQGVVSPEIINSGYNGTNVSIDYSFADYTTNYNYPSFAKWSQGYFDNLTSNTKSIKAPEYSLPEIYLNFETKESLFASCYAVQNSSNYNFFTFRPNSFWNTLNGYLYFPRLNLINGVVNAIWGVFETDSEATQEQVLIYIKNKNTQDYFKIYLLGKDIKYTMNIDEIAYDFVDVRTGFLDGGQYDTSIFEDELNADGTENLYEDEVSGGALENVELGIPFVVGIKIDKLIESFGYRVAKFFGDISSLEIYIANTNELDKTFTGKILSIGICNENNAEKFAKGFEDTGIVQLDFYELFLENLATYTLLPQVLYDKFYLDIGISGYWEDYMPLSYFGQYAKAYDGSDVYSLDFLQFNIGYPKPIENNGIFLNTDGHEIKSFVSFQFLDNGNNLLKSNFINTNKPNINSVINLNDYNDWMSTIFEVVDGTIIYPRTDYDFNDLAIVYRLEFNIKNTLNKPLLLSKLELCSQVFNKNYFNTIGTKFGIDVYPYKKSGIYFDYKAQNPYLIYKDSSPYLYLTKKSGIKMLDNQQSLADRGITIPINKFRALDYRISAIQFWALCDLPNFPEMPTKIFEISYSNDKIIFYMTSNSEISSDRAKIYAISENSGELYNGIAYYLNGKLVKSPVMSLNQWASIGIRFLTALDFDSTLGSINLSGPILFNNISYYKANNIQLLQSTINRPWSRVLSPENIGIVNWEYWDLQPNFTWNNLLIIGTSELYGIDPEDIYNTYIGTNKIIFDDSRGIGIEPDKVKVFKTVTWSSYVTIPA